MVFLSTRLRYILTFTAGGDPEGALRKLLGDAAGGRLVDQFFFWWICWKWMDILRFHGC